MVFFDYETGSKAYICLDLITFKLHIRRDVIFDESKNSKFDEQRSGRKISLLHSNILHVKGLEEPSSKSVEKSIERSISEELSNPVLSQPEESEDKEPLRYGFIQSIYDETKFDIQWIMSSLSWRAFYICFNSKSKDVERSNERGYLDIVKNKTWPLVKPEKMSNPSV